MKQVSADKFWHYSKEEAFASVAGNEQGITELQAEERRRLYGANTLKASTGTSGWLLFLRQFKTPITILLIGAATLSMLLGDRTDSYIIFAITLISSLLGFWQEKGAADAVSQLYKMIQVTCTALRNGQNTEIPVEAVVPGDIITLSAGVLVPADSILLSSHDLFADEAAFTGETYPVEKNPGVVDEEAPISSRTNCVFMGSHIISGKGTALVIKTGYRSEFGKISASLQSRAPETEFEQGIRKFGYLLMEITLLLVLVIFAVNVFLHKPVLDSFLFSLALAVGLTPQLLPVIISVNLATGAKKMAAKKVIVKRLSSIPNFGSISILCSDKTGTLTEGKVTVKETLDSSGNHSDRVLLYGWLNASLQQGFRNPIDEALCSTYTPAATEYCMQSEIPYDFIRKRLTIQVFNKQENIAITKGALLSILDVCSFSAGPDAVVIPIEQDKNNIIDIYKKNSAEGFRVLGLATKRITDGKDFTKEEETGMTFLGFITLFDPPKKEIVQTIRELKQLGVSLKIITGDNALVAENLVKQIGFENPVVMTGSDMRRMSSDAFYRNAVDTHVFAEVEPNQKEKIILALKKAGHVVGFMGDGINDATALHAADIGISVNTAVDVAKEAAAVILLEPDLKVLIRGIKEGRYTFVNTMKYVFMATSANFGNMFSMAGASVFLSFLPLLPKQILLTNLLTDLPEMTIATDRVDASAIIRPRRWDIRFIQRFMIVFGILSSIFDYCTFAVLLLLLKADEQTFQTGWFTESVVSASLIVLVMRTRLPFFRSMPGKPLLMTTACTIITVLILPYTAIGSLLGFVPLPVDCYAWILVIVILYVAGAELAKKWFYTKYAAS